MMDDLYKKKEKKLDEMMELERLKEVKYLEQRENEKKLSRIQSQKAVIDQILENDNIPEEKSLRDAISVNKGFYLSKNE